MKILVFSDSHHYVDYMLECTRRVMPDALIHLGDFYADSQVLHEAFSDIPIYAVPGNGDHDKAGPFPPAVRIVEIDGVRFFLTHGHKHGVKIDDSKLKADARRAGADAVLFGHTHEQVSECDGGLWVINPGACGAYSAGAALIVTADNKISHCAMLTR